MSDEVTVRGRWDEGPFLRVATFCEKYLEERDDVGSVIRIDEVAVGLRAG